jgi:hypothetical protein
MATVEAATEIRPFRVEVSDEVLDDLRHRIAATHRLRDRDVAAPADAVRARRLACRPRGDNALGFFDVKGAIVPAAVSVFPRALYRAPRSWAEEAHPNLICFNEVDEGNHFAAWQDPEIFTNELRAAFRQLREGRLS